MAKTEEHQIFNEAGLELYDMIADPAETVNLSAQHPQRLRDMYNDWQAWAARLKVLPFDTRGYDERAQAYNRNINGALMTTLAAGGL